MSSEPPRPATVPPAATWLGDEGQWRLQMEPDDARDPRVQTWRADGTLLLEATLKNGELNGPFQRFHRSGAIAREGRYVGGKIEGTVVCHPPSAQGDEQLRGCCVPNGAARMDAEYWEGGLVRETFFDAEGRPILSDGTPRPERPAPVPADSDFEESSRRWRHGPRFRGNSDGTWQWWRIDGSLAEEGDFQGGRRTARRIFDETGRAVEAIRYLHHEGFEEIANGPWWRCFSNADENPYSEVDVRVVRGNYDRGEATGTWLLEDAEGRVLRTVELGVRFDPSVFETVKADAPHLSLNAAAASAAHWTSQRDRLKAGGHMREALLAGVRAAGASGRIDCLRADLSLFCLPLKPAVAEADAARALGGDKRSVESLLSALIGGADAAAILRSLASEIGGTGRVGLDVVNAAILLAPDRDDAFLTRALLCIERGQVEAAHNDAARLVDREPEASQFIGAYARVVTPDFSFWPAGVDLPELPEDFPLSVEQPLEQVQWAFRLYATRLARAREAMRAFRSDSPPWLPPDLNAHLTAGAIELRKMEADIADVDEDGNEETTHIAIDETMHVDGLSFPALMRLARANWAGLTWLCWSVGLDAAVVPNDISTHPAFARALNVAMTRAWRAKDALVTGGLRSMTKGVPGFVWEELDIVDMPRVLAEMATDEYTEMRAVLLWLSNAGNLSPFQDDLRRVV